MSFGVDGVIRSEKASTCQEYLDAALDKHKEGLELGIFYHNLELAGISAKEAEALIKKGIETGLYYESQPGRLRRLE